MTTGQTFDIELRRIAQKFARAVFDEALRRSWTADVNDLIGAVNEISAEKPNTRIAQYATEATARLIWAAHSEATLADFRKELDQ